MIAALASILIGAVIGVLIGVINLTGAHATFRLWRTKGGRWAALIVAALVAYVDVCAYLIATRPA